MTISVRELDNSRNERPRYRDRSPSLTETRSRQRFPSRSPDSRREYVYPIERRDRDEYLEIYCYSERRREDRDRESNRDSEWRRHQDWRNHREPDRYVSSSYFSIVQERCLILSQDKIRLLRQKRIRLLQVVV